jgi:hypothetical protein
MKERSAGRSGKAGFRWKEAGRLEARETSQSYDSTFCLDLQFSGLFYDKRPILHRLGPGFSMVLQAPPPRRSCLHCPLGAPHRRLHWRISAELVLLKSSSQSWGSGCCLFISEVHEGGRLPSFCLRPTMVLTLTRTRFPACHTMLVAEHSYIAEEPCSRSSACRKCAADRRHQRRQRRRQGLQRLARQRPPVCSRGQRR